MGVTMARRRLKAKRRQKELKSKAQPETPQLDLKPKKAKGKPGGTNKR